MCDFQSGDEVVCIHVREGFACVGLAAPVKGRHYTVAFVGIADWPDGSECVGITLKELPEHPDGWAYAPEDFRKVQRRDLSAWLATTNTIEEPKRTPTKAPA